MTTPDLVRTFLDDLVVVGDTIAFADASIAPRRAVAQVRLDEPHD